MTPLFNSTEFDRAKRDTLLSLQCEQCNLPFLRSKKRIQDMLNPKQKRKGAFCSRACQLAYRRHRPAKTAVSCKGCGAVFNRLPSKVRVNNFCGRSCASQHFGLLRRKPKVIRPVIIKLPKPIIKCLTCSKDTLNRKYCSGTCRNVMLNKNIKGSKSKAERYLSELIKRELPDLVFLENDRKILDGLELDFFFPSLGLAIEWNGIFHYEPIHSKDALTRVMLKDNSKIEKCKSLGIELIVVCDRTSHMKFIAETCQSLISQLKTIIGKGQIP